MLRLSQKLLTATPRFTTTKLISFIYSNFNSNHAPRLRFTPNQLVLAQQNSGQIIRAKNTHTTNTKIAYHTCLQPNCSSLAARTANTFRSALQEISQISNFAKY